MTYAQTNLQLFNQMREQGYGDDDLAAVKTAYDLATKLFTAQIRGSGKPLLAHVVGTASVLCALRAPARLLAAAVLHAAYIFGEFGDGRRGWDRSKRSAVAAAVGSDIEQLIMRYHELQWNSASVATIAASLGGMDDRGKEALLIRLANELEDHLDLGVLYCGNAEGRREEIRCSLHLCVDMSRALNQPTLARELQRAFDEVLTKDVPEVLRGPREYTHALPPLSHRPMLSVTLRRVLDAHPRLGRMLHPGRLMKSAFNSRKTTAAIGSPVAPSH